MNRDFLKSYAAEQGLPDSWFYLLKGEVSPEPLPADQIPDFAELVTNAQRTETEGEEPEWFKFEANRPAAESKKGQPEKETDPRNPGQIHPAGTTAFR